MTVDTYRQPFRHPEARCVGVPSIMYPTKGKSARRAVNICDGCPARNACLEYAIVHNEEVGVWGGTTERERRAIRRQWIAEGRLVVVNNGNRKPRAWLTEVGA